MPGWFDWLPGLYEQARVGLGGPVSPAETFGPKAPQSVLDAQMGPAAPPVLTGAGLTSARGGRKPGDNMARYRQALQRGSQAFRPQEDQVLAEFYGPRRIR